MSREEKIEDQPDQPQQPQQPRNQGLRASPNLIRIYADNQDKKSLCCYWGILIAINILIFILANTALPPLFKSVVNPQGLERSNIANCKHPAGFNGNQIYCDNSPFATTLKIGEIFIQPTNLNQFGLVYLNIIPASPSQMSSSFININQNITFEMYRIQEVPPLLGGAGQTSFLSEGYIDKITALVTFPSSSLQRLYSPTDRQVQIGWTVLLVIFNQLDSTSRFLRMTFQKSSDFGANASLHMQTLFINEDYTRYIIIIRYFFLALSLVGCGLYFWRYRQVSPSERTFEMKMVSIAAFLLAFFNDPLFAITVLYPNGASATLSILFMTLLIAFIMLKWTMFAERIHKQYGQRETNLSFKFQILHAVVFLGLLIGLEMTLALDFITTKRIFLFGLGGILPLKVVLAIVGMAGIIFVILFRYISYCQDSLWRYQSYMYISSLFMIVIAVSLASNAFEIYNYSGTQVLFLYSLTNTYVLYIMYMFSATKEQLQLRRIEQAQDQRLTVGTIDLQQLNLDRNQSPRYDNDQQRSFHNESQGLHIKNEENSEIES